MKILKIFGIVVGIHVFALVLIFANPGCSSITKPPPAPSDTVAPMSAAPAITLPNTSAPAYASTSEPSPVTPAPIGINPDAPAVSASPSDSGSGVRFMPTRPGTPVAGALVVEPVVDVTPATTYAVKSGDSLWVIAKKNHLTAAELAAANGISTTAVLKPGQKLLIPAKPVSPVAAATAKAGAGPATKAPQAAPAAAMRSSQDSVKYVVKSGDNLGSIARIYGVKQGDIAVANNISDPAKIKAGDQLIIPGYQTPVSKSGKAGTKSGAAPKAGELKPALNVEQTPPPPPVGPPPVPVIRIDEGPITPAPKP